MKKKKNHFKPCSWSLKGYIFSWLYFQPSPNTHIHTSWGQRSQFLHTGAESGSRKLHFPTKVFPSNWQNCDKNAPPESQSKSPVIKSVQAKRDSERARDHRLVQVTTSVCRHDTWCVCSTPRDQSVKRESVGEEGVASQLTIVFPRQGWAGTLRCQNSFWCPHTEPKTQQQQKTIHPFLLLPHAWSFVSFVMSQKGRRQLWRLFYPLSQHQFQRKAVNTGLIGLFSGD